MADFTLSAKITGDAREFEKAMDAAQSKLKSVTSKFESFGKGISGVGKALMPITTAVGAVGTVAAKTSIDFTKLYESTMLVFEEMLGGTSAAQDLYSSLLDTAKASTYSQETFLKCGKQLVGMGVSADRTKKYLQATTNAVSAFGGSAQNIEGITNAFVKATNAGKLNMEVVNTLADNGVQALKILGNQYGVTTEEMQKMISSGAVPAEEALDKLTDGIQNGTDGVNGMTKAMDGMAAKLKGGTLTGALDSVKSAVRSFSLNLTGINPTLKENDEGYAESKKRIEQLTAVFSTIASILPKVATVFGGLTDGIGGLLDKLVGANVTLNEATGQWENVGGVLGKIQEKLDSFDPDKLKMVGNVILGLAAGGPILLTLGKSISKLAPIMNTVGGVAIKAGGNITKFFVGLDGMKMSVFSNLSPLNKLKTVMSGLMSPMGLAVVAIAALVAAFAYLMITNKDFRDSIMKTVNKLMKTLGPALSTIGEAIGSVAKTLAETLGSVVEELAPVIAQLVDVIAELVIAIAPFIAQLISQLAPVINKIVVVLGNLIKAIMPSLIAIISTILGVIQSLMPVIEAVLTTVMTVVSEIISAILPIVTFIGEVMVDIFNFIEPIIGFVTKVFGDVATIVSRVWTNILTFTGNIVSGITKVISGLIKVFSTVFEAIWVTVSTIMSTVGNFIGGVFSGIQTAWNGLTGFVNGVFDGISTAVNTLVDGVKGVVNFVIDGINGAIDLINNIPGVNIDNISYLLHGTDNWQGGFARMNEGGRGELTYLPNGAQVIPHDISVKYAKESARANATQVYGNEIDYDYLIGGLADAIISRPNVTVVELEGRQIAIAASPQMDTELGQREVMAKRGG